MNVSCDKWRTWSSFSSFVVIHRLEVKRELTTPPSFLFPETDFNIKVVKHFPKFASYPCSPNLELVSCIQVCWWVSILKGRESKWVSRLSSAGALSYLLCSERNEDYPILKILPCLLVCKLGPVYAGQGEIKERGRPLQVGRWHIYIFYKNFFQPMACLFILLIETFQDQNILILTNSNLSMLSLCFLMFWGIIFSLFFFFYLIQSHKLFILFSSRSFIVSEFIHKPVKLFWVNFCVQYRV